MKYALTLLAPAMAAAVSLKTLLGETEITHEMYQSGRVHDAVMHYKMVLCCPSPRHVSSQKLT